MVLEWTQQVTVRKGGLVEVIVPSLEEGRTVEVVVREGAHSQLKQRRFGSAKGEGHMTADFDEPLTDFHE